MGDPLHLLLLGFATLAAATLASITGFGGSAIMLPLTVMAFGVRDGIPILAIAQLIGNGSRVWFNRRDIALPVVKWYSLGCIPGAILGGILFTLVPIPNLTRVLGVLLLGIVVLRHLPKKPKLKLSAQTFAPIGVASGLVSAFVGSVGPFVAPFFLAFGLVKGAYVGTEAFSAVILHMAKIGTYGGMHLLTPYHVAIGAALGPTMIIGSLIGKCVMDRLPEKCFVWLIDGMLLLAGGCFLLAG